MSYFEKFIILFLAMLPFAVLYAVVEHSREQKEFRRWLRERGWKFEKMKH